MDENKKNGSRYKDSVYFSRAVPTGYAVAGSLWMEKGGRLYVDVKRVKLLNLIGEFGSITAAARSMRMAYNNAWFCVTEMNRLGPSPLVEKKCGGVNGGYSTLTAEGRKVIAEFNRLNHRLEETINQLTGFGLSLFKFSERTSTANLEVANDVKAQRRAPVNGKY
jgi:molybdate transport system regulatory protein